VKKYLGLKEIFSHNS